MSQYHIQTRTPKLQHPKSIIEHQNTVLLRSNVVSHITVYYDQYPQDSGIIAVQHTLIPLYIRV